MCSVHNSFSGVPTPFIFFIFFQNSDFLVFVLDFFDSADTYGDKTSGLGGSMGGFSWWIRPCMVSHKQD